MTSLFLRMLNVSIIASWITLVILLLRFLLKKSPRWITCLLWIIVALRLLLPFFPESRMSLIPSAEPLIRQTVSEQTTAASDGADAPANHTSLSQPDHWEQFLPAASVIWLAGTGLLLVYGLVSWLRLRHKVQASIRQEKNVYACDQVDSPFILGCFCPRIYVPSGMEEQVLQCVLAHENAHIRRKDHWWKPLAFVLLAVYWFNPVLWLVYILLCRDIESACDEKAVAGMDTAGKQRYSQALILCSIPRRMIMTCPVAFGEVAIKERIKRVLYYKKPAVWLVAISAVVCLVASVCLLTNPKICRHEYTGEITVQSTCARSGTELFTCTQCGDSYTVPVPLLTHSYDEGTVIQPADCIHTGTAELTCTVCGDKCTQTLGITAHQTEQVAVLKASTCTEKGQVSVTCTLCHADFLEELPLDLQNHNLEESVVRVSTCAVEGEGTLTCTRCAYSETLTYPRKEHSYVDDTILLMSTCAWEGQRQQICTGCGATRVVTIPTNDAHHWISNIYNEVCTICGESRPIPNAAIPTPPSILDLTSTPPDAYKDP